MFKTRSRKVLGTVVTCLIAGIAALAFAAWLQDSRAPATVKVGQLQVPVGTAGTAGAPCLPNNLCEATIAFNNTNNADLEVTGSEWDQFETPVSAPGCPASNIEPQTVTGLALAVPKNGTTQVAIPGAFKLRADAPTACQNKELQRGLLVHFRTTNGG